jgi:DNA-binding GntR family transcriptional regulator
MAQAALVELRDAIVAGELKPGAPLRLEALADSLGMSISPVREAVRQLEGLGLAVHVPHRGARVTELAIEDLRDAYEARLALETIAVRRAAARFTASDAAAARAHLDAYAAAHERGDTREARQAHADFHFTLYSASGSGWLVRLIRPVWENTERYRALSLRSTPRSERQAEHEAILAACGRHDPDDAARHLRRHLGETANLVARQMGAGELFQA